MTKKWSDIKRETDKLTAEEITSMYNRPAPVILGEMVEAETRKRRDERWIKRLKPVRAVTTEEGDALIIEWNLPDGTYIDVEIEDPKIMEWMKAKGGEYEHWKWEKVEDKDG
jgi:hypothetical protein